MVCGLRLALIDCLHRYSLPLAELPFECNEADLGVRCSKVAGKIEIDAVHAVELGHPDTRVAMQGLGGR